MHINLSKPRLQRFRINCDYIRRAPNIPEFVYIKAVDYWFAAEIFASRYDCWLEVFSNWDWQDDRFHFEMYTPTPDDSIYCMQIKKVGKSEK